MLLIKKYIPSKLKRTYRILKKKWNSIKRSGNAVYCPICSKSYKIFDSFGLPKRKNALCYHCGSLERHRLIFLFLNQELDLFKPKNKISLLHFAPERFFYKLFFNHNLISYQPVDLYPDLYDFATDIEVRKADITDLPFQDQKFDFIMCNHVLEHIVDDDKAMSELFRVLKPKGIAIVQVPINTKLDKSYEDFSIIEPKEREVAFGQKDHVRWYGLDYPKRLESVGFKVEINNFVTKFSKAETFKFGLTSYENIYLARKD